MSGGGHSSIPPRSVTTLAATMGRVLANAEAALLHQRRAVGLRLAAAGRLTASRDRH